MKKLFVFGNEYLKGDSFALQVADHLKNECETIHCRSPEDLFDVDDEEITILDVVKGINRPVLITDIDKIKTRSLISLHDFDLGFFLKLMKKMGLKKIVRILGVPESGNSLNIANGVRPWI
jgi:Ni,Fe-hydrogenase maturation factor